jgi:hypothetical protein
VLEFSAVKVIPNDLPNDLLSELISRENRATAGADDCPPENWGKGLGCREAPRPSGGKRILTIVIASIPHFSAPTSFLNAWLCVRQNRDPASELRNSVLGEV